MNSIIQENCARLAEYYQIISAENKLENSELVLACAGICLAAGKQPDMERLAACRKLLKKRKGLFSNFRGFGELIVLTSMALSADPESYFDKLESIYQDLKSFFSGEQTVLAAIILTDWADAANAAELVQSTKAIYKNMKQAHPWLTSEEDMPFAALMASTGRDCSAVYEEAENIYQQLKGRLRAEKNTLQMLSHILAIREGSPDEKCAKLCALAEGLKKAGHGLGGGSRLAVLGILADAKRPAEELVELVVEADDCLKQYKPFHGLFGVGKENRRMFAVQMVPAAEAGREALGISAMMAASVELAIITMIYLMIITSSSASVSTHS